MDQAFMEEYYERFYEDPIQRAMAQCHRLWQLRDIHDTQEKKLLEQVGGLTTAAWKAYEETVRIQNEITELLCETIYLMGAQDRERMLG